MSILKFQGKVITSAIFAIALSILFFTGPALASGVGVSPSHLEFGSNGSGFNSTLYVINTGDEDSLYRVYVDNEYENWFNISPEEFLLAPDRTAEVQISVTPRWSIQSDHTAYIYVESFEPTAETQVGAGIKVPAYISTGNSLLPLIIGIPVAALVALISIIYIIRRNRRLRRRLEAQKVDLTDRTHTSGHPTD